MSVGWVAMRVAGWNIIRHWNRMIIERRIKFIKQITNDEALVAIDSGGGWYVCGFGGDYEYS